MYKKLIIIGVNGHGKVAADVAASMGIYESIEFLCNFEKKTECMGFPIIGKNSDADKYIDEADFFVAIGENEIRQKMMEELECKGAHFATLIHASAILGSRVEIGAGTVIMPGVILNAETKVGKGCILNTASTADHGSVLSDYVHLSVGAHLCGQTEIGSRTWIGAGATVIQAVHICADVTVGAGAVVLKNIKEAGTYVGVPARKL